MDSPAGFRGALRRRLLTLLGPALLAGPVACAPTIIDSQSVGGGGSVTRTREDVGGGGPGGHGNGGCSLTTTGASSGTGAPPATQLTACIAPLATGCPDEYNAAMYVVPAEACYGLQSIDCGPVMQDGQCCYVVTEDFVGCAGRPFVVRGAARTASSLEGSDWSGALAPPALSALSGSERGALAKAWTREALAEHASIASFSRFALELLAVGAPADLVAGAHQSALDEVRHAALGFALASAYAGRDVGPSPFPLDGALGSTTLVVAQQLEEATDPAVRAALEEIAADEARHAELAWKTVAWALEVGGDEIRGAVTEVMREAARYTPEAGDPLAPEVRSGVLRAHGRLDRAAARVATERALEEVVRPCAARLLGRAAEHAAFASS
jgi:hypothetical protein